MALRATLADPHPRDQQIVDGGRGGGFCSLREHCAEQKPNQKLQISKICCSPDLLQHLVRMIDIAYIHILGLPLV
jgi:hypothetical protein